MADGRNALNFDKISYTIQEFSLRNTAKIENTPE
jgi:hypothetical protein